MLDKAAATSELTAALEQTPATSTEQQNATEKSAQEFYEMPWEGKSLKIPLNYKLPLKENGKIEEVELSTLFNKYRNANQMQRKYEELHKTHNGILGEIGDLDQFKTQKQKYDAIQAWSEQNPQDWERLYEMFSNREKYLLNNQPGQEGSEKLLQTIAQLRQEIDGIKQGPISQYQKDLEDRQNQEVVRQVNEEMENFQKEFPEFKLEEKDVDGIDRKSAIIKHGIDNGIPTFTAAAYSLYGKELVKAAEERGRKSLTESIKKDNANGIVTRQSIPNGQVPRATDNRSSKVDYKTAAAEELRELLSKA